MLKQSLSQKMIQKLSPQQIQLMKLLQIPTATLDQRIKEELEANPALEEGEERDDLLDLGADEADFAEYGEDLTNEETSREEVFELDDYLNDYIEDDPASYKFKAESSGSEEEDKNIPISVQNSFHEHLEQQLGLLNFSSEREEIIAHQIVGSIDEDGYLRRDPEAIIDDLMFVQNVQASRAEVDKWLREIQRFDPPGVGAKDLQECLILQLDLKLEAEDLDLEQEESLKIARQILASHFEEFSKKHYQRLIRRLNIEEEDLRDAIQEVLKLNPKPASGYASGQSRGTQYVVPDFIIVNRDGELELTLNARNAPDLRINDQYKDMLQTYSANKKSGKSNQKNRDAVLFIKQKIDSARWFIDAIRQRQDTMYRTMYAIMQLQYDYFLTGDDMKLRPMILKDVAEITGLDISTVSRVANSKYVQTEFGTKRLKEFFSEGMQNQEGEEVSTLEIKKILEEIAAGEDKRKPYSDEKLKKLLEEKGYNIARRTVAKYREQLNIPVARLRKQL